MNKTSPSSPPKSPNSQSKLPHLLEPPNSPANQLFLTPTPSEPSAMPRYPFSPMAHNPLTVTDWPFSAPASIVTHPHPREFIGLDPFDERAIRTTFANAPLLKPMGYKDHDLIRHYKDAGMLPGGFPVKALDSYDSKNHCVALPTEVRVGCSDAERQAAWARIIYKHIRRTPSGHPTSEETGVDTWSFRTEGEITLGSAIGGSTSVEGQGQVGVRQEALFFQQRILRAELRFL